MTDPYGRGHVPDPPPSRWERFKRWMEVYRGEIGFGAVAFIFVAFAVVITIPGWRSAGEARRFGNECKRRCYEQSRRMVEADDRRDLCVCGPDGSVELVDVEGD